MHYIKVLATDSTNADLKKMSRANTQMENTCLLAKNQTRGRGQRGADWRVNPNENLTFSVLLKGLNLKAEQQFKLSALVALALVEFLHQRIKNTDFKVKWPNDILAGNRKICGILIENTLEAANIQNSVIGIGLNVNQTNFENLHQASSLKNATGETFDLGELWKGLTEFLEKEVYAGLKLPLEMVLKKYETRLFRLKQSSIFEFPNGKKSTGKIQGVLPSGRLQIRFGEKMEDFDLKEVKLVY